MSPRTVNVLEGETLLNDTTAFVIYRFAVRAATTGAFDARTAVPLFLLVAAGGAVVGWVVYRVVRFMSERLADPVLETVLLLMTPFAAYLPAEAFGASGVLAVVVAGVLLRRSSALLVPARARLQGSAVYSLAPLVRVLDQAPDRSRDAEEALARQHMIAAGEALLERRQRDGDVPEAVIEPVRRKHREQGELEIALNVEDEGRRLGAMERALERELLGARRRAAVHLQRDQVIDDAVLHELERELDLEDQA